MLIKHAMASPSLFLLHSKHLSGGRRIYVGIHPRVVDTDSVAREVSGELDSEHLIGWEARLETNGHENGGFSPPTLPPALAAWFSELPGLSRSSAIACSTFQMSQG